MSDNWLHSEWQKWLDEVGDKDGPVGSDAWITQRVAESFRKVMAMSDEEIEAAVKKEKRV
jgi:hypothetical protein